MRITGKLHSFGILQIAVDVQQTDGWIAKQIRDVKGVLIECTDDATLRDASELFCATVDIYPHPVNELIKGECTPENYAHALARLAHTEDHLAREVKSSQALTMLHEGLRVLTDGAITVAKDLRAEVKRLRRALLNHGISVDTSGEEYDDGPDERGRDENGNALA